jgi:Uma2 family endonuclease
MGAVAIQSPMTLDEYFRMETDAEERHEFHEGRVVAMAGGTGRHSRIAANVIGRLLGRLEGNGCYPLDSNIRIRIPRKAKYYYSDCVVVCGELQYDPAAPPETTIQNPRLIVEVLSDSTEAFDRGDKFTDYREIESLREYILIAQHTPRVEVYVRLPDGMWRFQPAAGLEASAKLEELGIELPLAEVYAGITF